jgi:hypothetical protein
MKPSLCIKWSPIEKGIKRSENDWGEISLAFGALGADPLAEFGDGGFFGKIRAGQDVVAFPALYFDAERAD